MTQSRLIAWWLVATSTLLVAACDSTDDASGDAVSVSGPACDSLLSPADFQNVCGAEILLEATMFEGLEGNPCNRSAAENQALMLVTRHPTPSVASMGADAAGGRGPEHQEGLGLYASAGSAGVFVVEVKATADPGAPCRPQDLPTLLDLALSRLPTAEGS